MHWSKLISLLENIWIFSVKQIQFCSLYRGILTSFALGYSSLPITLLEPKAKVIFYYQLISPSAQFSKLNLFRSLWRLEKSGFHCSSLELQRAVLGLSNCYVAGKQWTYGVSRHVSSDNEWKEHQRQKALHLVVDVDWIYCSVRLFISSDLSDSSRSQGKRCIRICGLVRLYPWHIMMNHTCIQNAKSWPKMNHVRIVHAFSGIWAEWKQSPWLKNSI